MTKLSKQLRNLSAAFAMFLTVFALIPASTVQAAAISTITDQVTDPESFLSQSETTKVREKLQSAQDSGVQIYFAVFPKFTDAPTKWCTNSAKNSGLPNSAILYAIAYDARNYVACHGNSAPYSDSQITAATGEAVDYLHENPLSGQAAADAAVAFTDSLLNSTSSDTNTVNSSSFYSPNSGISEVIKGLIGPLFAFIIPLALIFFFFKKNKANLPTSGLPTAKNLEEVLKETASQLMATDNSVRSATDDLAFAQAQFGQLETKEFATALAQAQQLISEAFTLHQTINQETDVVRKRQTASRVSELCQQAQNALAANVERFNKLRSDGANLPQNISNLQQQIAEAQVKNEQAKREIDSLRVIYPDEKLRSLFDNPGNVTNLLGAASAALEQANTALATGTLSAEQEARHQVTMAQRTFGQAINQINEVMYASQDLADAPARLASAIGSIAADLEDVKRLGANQAAFHGIVTNANNAIERANRALADEGDVLESLANLRITEDALDAALAPLRAVSDQLQRDRQRFALLDGEVQSLIRQADSYISSNRGAVGQDARSALATALSSQQQAQQHFNAYLQSGNPDKQRLDTCFQLLNQAKSSAQNALTIATSESQQMRYSPGSLRQTRSGEIDLTSLILGGILSGSRSSSYGHSHGSPSGWSGGGFSGGSSWGSSSGGGWSSSSSGSF
ncbi:hypothetical protein HMPREF0044_0251 [Gleimia coleocanis DSM 15436]|uniref:TPM domain-containing protein n=1 Tax=Gleimia coleocanis DSM 15436 TaxID=525245 RepID=C0VYL1_9ACTO|nr:TPM domain-containing protein [Gleimia coleocanis]EEH64514.1 hypothetical protein HMPREF0044_0251 [Gleimia coleocanis DSM 15436]